MLVRFDLSEWHVAFLPLHAMLFACFNHPERARTLDEAIKENLQEKRRLVAEFINEVEAGDRQEQVSYIDIKQLI